MNTIAEYGAPAVSAAPRRDRIVQTIFWLEWRRHRLGAVAAFLFLFPTLAVCSAVEQAREGMFFWLAMSMAWGTGLGVGRVEWMEGEEEFQLTLPATRAQRYWVMFSMGALLLAMVYAIGVVTCFTDWFVFLGDALRLGEYPAEDLPPTFGSGPAFVTVAIVAPLAVYVEFFASSMAISRRGELGWIVRLPFLLAAGFGLLHLGTSWLGESAGWLTAPVLLGYAIARAGHGACVYQRKDAVLDVQTTGAADRQRALVIAAVLLALGLAAGLAVFFLSR